MKTLIRSLALLALVGCTLSPSQAFATDPPPLPLPAPAAAMTEAQWGQYAHHIEAALASDHEGLQQTAMQRIIQYGTNLHFGRAATIYLVRLYREHDNDNVRRMAVVTLGQMDDAWGIGFLARSLAFEDNKAVQHTMRAVINAYRAPNPTDGPSLSTS